MKMIWLAWNNTPRVFNYTQNNEVPSVIIEIWFYLNESQFVHHMDFTSVKVNPDTDWLDDQGSAG